jgi:signal transduction histidine kinase
MNELERTTEQRILHAVDLASVQEYDRAKALLETLDDPLGNRLFLLIAALEQRFRARTERQAELRHEIGNALGVVQANVEGMLDGVLEPAHDRLRGVHDALKTAIGLLEEWKAERAPAAPKINVCLDTFNVCETIVAQASMISGMAVAKNVRVVYDPCARHYAACEFFRGDSDRIGQLLRNVLINAVRYTPPGGTVEIDCGRPGGELTLRISDTGPGIPREDLPHVFERGFRGKNVEEEGSGTGLAVASDIAEAIGGDIRIESQHEHGATFVIQIPAAPLAERVASSR